MAAYALDDQSPTLPETGSFWIAPGAHVIGRVILARDSSVWFGAVLRGDNEVLEIGEGTNIQEHVMVHSDPGYPVSIGRHVTVGHRAIVHGCTIGDNTLIGMGATVLNGARIGRNCLIGAGALVTEGKEIPDGLLVMGAPAKVVRALDEAAIEGLEISAQTYIRHWKRFITKLKEIDTK
ncbi:gamma carbonic anhydrase family protein (plasmid) [Rhizobium sullae]|uniref:Gamma carbonic anhydrase family protein n=1 Tax=Rhizobium sullae TaxID=50338 RepID=A0ABY5XX52_RHISU|nr:gamma carbonic anhydrase family protein [Rhizobium sullae]UWU19230.1 gamma carbonic anhydrase family protein [Rhizobium sullae]